MLLHDDVKNNLSTKQTEELLEIWVNNNRDEWSEEAFSVIKEILTERKVVVPLQRTHHVQKTPDGKIVLDETISLDQFVAFVKDAFGKSRSVVVKKKQIVVIQDSFRGCSILFNAQGGKIVVKGLWGFMPSGWFRAVVVLGIMVLFFVIGLSMGYIVTGLGLIPIAIMLVLTKLPSRSLVKKVRQALDVFAAEQCT